MRVAVFVLAGLVFAAGLILDTGAVLALVGGFLWHHAVYAASVCLLVVTLVAGWRLLHRRPARSSAVGLGRFDGRPGRASRAWAADAREAGAGKSVRAK